jgi:alpha-N-arabinofuranosidase
MMRGVDPSIEVVACGSCSMGLPTYLEWDRQVLEHCGDTVDYLSMHRYVGNAAGDTADFLAVAASIDRQIEEMDAVCRFVQARLRSKKRVLLCFDEWNVWYRATDGDGKGKTAPHLLEEVHNLEDALVAAGFLQSFIRHADVVKIANLAQIVNVIAPVLTQGDRTLVQSIFYPFEMISRRRDGSALRVAVDGPCYESRSHGTIAFIDASAILGAGRLHTRRLRCASPLPTGPSIPLTARRFSRVRDRRRGTRLKVPTSSLRRVLRPRALVAAPCSVNFRRSRSLPQA